MTSLRVYTKVVSLEFLNWDDLQDKFRQNLIEEYEVSFLKNNCIYKLYVTNDTINILFKEIDDVDGYDLLFNETEESFYGEASYKQAIDEFIKYWDECV